MTRRSAILAVLCVLVVSGMTFPQDIERRTVEGYPGVPVVGPWIRIHQATKQLRGNEAPRHFSRPVDMDHLDSERVAVYVHEAFQPHELDELEQLGVDVNRHVFVPPVRNRHPFGFHLARVPYDRIPDLVEFGKVVMLRSLDTRSEPTNNRTVEETNADDVHEGVDVVESYDGTGTAVAIADSGIDLSHDDFPEPEEAYDVTSGDGPSDWDDDVSNTVVMHGTHVAGICLGRGTLSEDNTGNGGGAYQGCAPGADLYFYKIGDDTTGGAADAWEVLAVDRAAAVGCDVFSMSYGGVSTYLDGSAPACQAIDAATDDGLLCFISAGNEGDRDRHYSAEVAPGEIVALDFLVTNPFLDAIDVTIDLRLIWIDDEPDDQQVALTCTNLESGEILTLESEQTSLRETESGIYTLELSLDALETRICEFEIENEAADGDTPRVHLWRVSGAGVFDDPDPNYTITHPAVADTAIAVGATVQRSIWTDADGVDRTVTLTVGALADFSSRGPRVDGVMKPDVTAPGAMTISCRDGDFANAPSSIVDNDGEDVDGSGPADYYVASGTSMASPAAAGVGALLIAAQPDWSVEEILACLRETAGAADDPDDEVGYGLVDAQAAITCAIDCNLNDVLDSEEVEDGSVSDLDDNGIPDSCQEGLIVFNLWFGAESTTSGDETLEVEVFLDTTVEVAGYQFGVCHESQVALGSEDDVAAGSAIDIDDDFTFHALQVFSDEGWTVGALYDVTTDQSLAVGLEHQLYVVSYGLELPGEADFEFCGTVGDPQVEPEIISGTEAFEPETGTLTVEVGGGFLRGDANSDERIDVSDPFYIGRALFDDGPEVSCDDAGDADDSEALDIGDALFLLIYLFSEGPDLASPFPACGEDEDGDDLGCAEPYCT